MLQHDLKKIDLIKFCCCNLIRFVRFVRFIRFACCIYRGIILL